MTPTITLLLVEDEPIVSLDLKDISRERDSM